jgi:hypothetical protein
MGGTPTSLCSTTSCGTRSEQEDPEQREGLQELRFVIVGQHWRGRLAAGGRDGGYGLGAVTIPGSNFAYESHGGTAMASQVSEPLVGLGRDAIASTGAGAGHAGQVAHLDSQAVRA